MNSSSLWGAMIRTDNARDASGIQSAYAYPATCEVEIVKGKIFEVHHIYDTVDPNGTTDYDAAPIGSQYTWILAGSVDVFKKTTATLWVSLT